MMDPLRGASAAVTQKAMEMKRAKISSVDRVDQRISRETSNTLYSMIKNEFHRPTAQYMEKKSNSKSSQMFLMTGTGAGAGGAGTGSQR